MLQWLNRVLTELWPYYDKAAAAMIKVKIALQVPQLVQVFI